jgi:branched-chain amino acid transport system permease protein
MRYVLIASSLAIVLIVIVKWRFTLGFALKAIKQNESAAEGMGIDTYRTKLIALVLSASLGAMMGTVYVFGSLFLLTTHAVFGLFIIVRVLSINIVGGLGTLWGPVIAAAIMVPLGEFLNAEFGHRAPGVQDLVYGAALIAAVIYMPSGIWGRISEAIENRRKKLVPKMKSFPGDGEP